MSCEAFAGEIVKMVVAIICKSAGFDSMTRSSCEALCDVLIAYLEELGLTAHQYAEHACRTEVNPVDVKIALRTDFRVEWSSFVSWVKKEKTQSRLDTHPFDYPLPPFPIHRPRERLTPQAQDTPALRPGYVPSFLPPFPPTYTYLETPVVVWSLRKHHLTLSSNGSKDQRINNKLKVLCQG